MKQRTSFISDECAGTSIEFAISLLFFLIIVATIAQIAFVLHARIIVQYAASCAARSAVVWIPAETVGAYPEPRNKILFEPAIENSKLFHIKAAAVIACIPIAPRYSVSKLTETSEESDPISEYVADQIDNVYNYIMGSAGLSSSTLVGLLEKYVMSNELTNVEISPPENGTDTYTDHELLKIKVTHSYYVDIPGPLTINRGYIDISQMVLLPNNGEIDFPE